MGVDLTLVEILDLRHGDIWMLKSVKKTEIDGWAVPLEGPDVIRWYMTLTIVPPEDWPEAPYGFYRSHLRYGDLEVLTEEEIMKNFTKLMYEKKPDRKYFSRNALKNVGLNLVWVRRVKTI